MRRWLWLPTAFILSFLILASFVVLTETGLKVIGKVINKTGGDVLSVQSVSGRLASTWQIDGVTLNLPTLKLAVGKVHCQWNPLQLMTGKLDILNFETEDIVFDFQTGSGNNESRQDFVPFPLVLPFRIDIDQLAIGKVTFKADGEDVFLIDRLGGRFSSGISNVAIDDFYLYSTDVDLKIHGSIDMSNEWQLDLMGRYRFVNYGFHELRGTFSSKGNLLAPHVELGVNSPADIRIVGNIDGLFSGFNFHANVKAHEVDLSKLIKYCPEIMLHQVDGDITGDLDGYGGKVTASGTWGVMDAMHLTTAIKADWWGIDFQSLQIERKDGIALAENAKISWREYFDWEGDFDFRAFDPEPLADVLHGRLSATFSSVGKVREDGLESTFLIDRIGGVLNERPVSGTGVMYLTETGISTDGLMLSSGELAGTAEIENGSFSWEGDLPWTVEAVLTDFDPGGLNIELYGKVSGKIDAEGSWPEKQMIGRLSVNDLSGEVRGLPLSGGGSLKFLGENIETSGFAIQLGDSAFAVKGRAGDNLAVDYNLSVNDLGSLVTGFKGSVDASGTVVGNPGSPVLTLNLNADNLSGDAFSVQKITGAATYHFDNTKTIDAVVKSDSIEISGYPVNSSIIKISGSVPEHRVDLSGQGAFGKMSFVVAGQYIDDWRGKISGTKIESPYGLWEQKELSSASFGPDGFLLSNFCLQNAGSIICAGGGVQSIADSGDIGWKLNTRLEQVALSWLNSLDIVSFPVSGIVDGSMEARGRGSEVDAAKGFVRLPEADLQLDIEDEDLSNIVLDDSRLDFDLNGGLLLVEVATEIHGDGGISAVARVNGLHRIGSSLSPLPVDGSVALKNFDISLLSAFSGNYLQPTGRVTNSFQIGGTIGHPEFQGKLNIDGGGIFLPYQGITLEGLELDVQAADNGAHVICRAQSGSGKIIARGMVQWGAREIEGSFAITGKDFLLVSLPEYSIRVNPAVHFYFSGQSGSVSGEVVVPYARIAPEEMTGSVAVSEDVIYVNGRDEEKNSSWPVSLDLRVSMGDDVRIDGYGLTGQVLGNLKVKTSTDEALTGDGEITLKDASFTIYGRSLDIVRGRLLFSGGALDNPGVDVRAQKKVSDEEAKGVGYTVGVDISGLVQDLQFHLFSDPYMEETEILSRMLVGSSLADATPEEGGLLEAALVTLGVQGSGSFVKGIGDFLALDDMHLEGSSSREDVSLVVGKRLTDDLYIGYDVNMFSRLGQFRVRYNLNHGFAVETKSSTESTGADLLYSIER